MQLTPLPLPLDDLPASIRRFCDPTAPVAARTMAARGLVPLKGEELVTMLVQLAASDEDVIATNAHESLGKLPPGVVVAAAASELHPSVLDALVLTHSSSREVLEALVLNHGSADITVERIARTTDERLCETIAHNEKRLLGAPAIIEALYKNKNCRMSTADRLVELAARNGVELTGVPTFKAHLEALQNELVPAEPTEEPLPDDEAFQKALELDDDDPDAVVIDKVEG